MAAGLVLAGLPTAAYAAADQQRVSTEELRELVEALEDDGEREQLVRRLNALIELRRGEQETPEDQTLGAIIIEQLSRHSAALGEQLSELASALLDIPRGISRLGDSLADPDSRQRWIDGLLAFIVVVVAGLAAGRLARHLLRRPLTAVSGRKGDGVLVRIPMLAVRLLLILVPPTAFAMAGWGTASLFPVDGAARPVALAAIYAAALAGAINAAVRVILAPDSAASRPVDIGDETAQYLSIWVRRFADIGIYGYFTLQAAGFMGLSAPVQSFLFKLIGLVLALLAIMLILQNRVSISKWIGGGDGRLAILRRYIAELWQVLAILYVVVVYLVWAIGMPGGFPYVLRATVLSALAVFLAVAVVNFLMRAIEQTFALKPNVKERFPGLEARVNRYLPAIRTVLRTLVAVVATIAVMQAWGLDIVSWLGEPAGRVVLARLAAIGAVIILAFAGWEVLNIGIERYLSSGGGAESQRARTLLPLFRKVAMAVLCVVVGLTVLSELGINIAPLLAGAGVVGLAVGFGAQTLVKDVITGMFILIEDTVSVGDYVGLAGHEGTVEALSIRSIRLRDPSGTVHTVPFSDVTSVINYTRDFAFAVMQIGVGYSEDTDRVSAVIEEVGRALRADPEQAPVILEDLQVQGVDRFDDSAVVIKARIKTAPGWQWSVRRAFNRLLKQRFDEEGIEIPFPQQTVWFAGDQPPADAQTRHKGRTPRARDPAPDGDDDKDGKT
jgi:small conductance mechanosensitive channel